MSTRAIKQALAVSLVVLFSSFGAPCQATYHLHRETASTGYYLLSTNIPDSASMTLSTSDLKGKTGTIWAANWATAPGVPAVVGTIPAGSTVQFSIWMQKSANYGTVYPTVNVGKLDSSQNATTFAVATAPTQLTTTLTKFTFSVNFQTSQNFAASDRWWIEVGAYIPSGGSTTKSLTASVTFEGNATSYDSMVTFPAIVPIPVSIITVSPQNAYVAIGASQPFTATGNYSDGSHSDITTDVTWSSSSPQVASVNSNGLVTAIATGNTSVTATLGNIVGGSNVNVTQSALTSITISSANTSLAIGLKKTLYATAHFADGSSSDVSSLVNWISSQPAVATIDNCGRVASIAVGTTTISATLSTFVASSSLTVTGPVVINALASPSNIVLAVGSSQQLTAIGTLSDGTTQDITSSSTWTSSTPAVATVSSGGLVTAVSPGSALISIGSGNFTFPAPITVSSPGPPVITASVLPAPNSAGWNNGPVTISFTCVPGSAPVASCPSPQVISSEGMNQTVTGTVTDTLGNSISTTISLNIDRTVPTLSISAPNEGDTISASSVTAVGSVSDSGSGISTVTCNGSAANIQGSSFSCVVALNPGLNLIAVRTTDQAGNVALTPLHVTDPLYSVPTSVQITPSTVYLTVGDSRQFTAVDDKGRPRPDASWSLPRRTTIASITSDAMPVLTANAIGQVVLTATVQGITTQATVNILSAPGTMNWSSPNNLGVLGLTAVAAAPSAHGPGLFSYANGILQALTNDGRQLWKTSGLSPFLFPDAYGGALFTGAGNGMVDIDGRTGASLWTSSFAPGTVTVRADGSIGGYGSETSAPPSSLGSLFVVNGLTGQSNRQPWPTLSSGTTTYSGTCGPPATVATSYLGQPSNTVTSDGFGNAYLEYRTYTGYETDIKDANADCRIVAGSSLNDSQLYLLTILPDGSLSSRLIARKSWFNQFSNGSNSFGGSTVEPGSVTPDGNGGVLATWTELPNGGLPSIYMVSRITPSGQSDFHIAPLDGMKPWGPGNNMPGTVVLDDQGIGYLHSTPDSTKYPDTIVAFDINSGNVLWSAQTGLIVTYIFAQGGGGAVVHGVDLNNNWGRAIIDNTGNVSSTASSDTILFDGSAGQWYSIGQQTIAALNLPISADAASFFAESLGNASKNGFGGPQCGCLDESTNATGNLAAEASQNTDGTLTGVDSSVAGCQICDLTPPPITQASTQNSCLTLEANGQTFLILVGDPGLDHNGVSHNVGLAFALAAQQKTNDLQARGGRVVACRISTIEQFNYALTHYGLITGDVIYFGHSGLNRIRDSAGSTVGQASEVFVGQGTEDNTNIAAYDITVLSNAYLSSGTAIRLNGCGAGLAVQDFYAKKITSIAQMIANQLNRGVYAYVEGTYFSSVDSAHDPFTDGKGRYAPSTLPVYVVPEGAPGDKPLPILFVPGH